jgi:hypothetical protein
VFYKAFITHPATLRQDLSGEKKRHIGQAA